MLSKIKANTRNNFTTILVAIILIVCILIAVGVYETVMYEKSVLEIYANQQDAYVQLVLDQINIQPDRTDEDIISDILGSLDKSSNKYWTLSKERNLLYVKDVTETNRYKGMSTPSFYTSESATRFWDKLAINRVTHEVIEMEESQYIASGVIFEYNHSQYRICLLTNVTFILDNNEYLAARISVYLYLAVLILVILLTAMILTNMLTRREDKIRRLETKKEELNRTISELENEILFMDRFHSRWSLYEEVMIEEFVSKLEQRNVYPVSLMQLEFENRGEMNVFLEDAQELLDEKVLRFVKGEKGLLLVFVQYNSKEAKSALERISGARYQVKKETACENPEQKLSDCYAGIL